MSSRAARRPGFPAGKHRRRIALRAQVMRSLNEHLTEEQIKDMILEVDCQGDCRINRDEFLDMMCNF